ncbi:branched-chain amino acid ABC transporter permease [Azospirillum rugosum]|uniref:Branched-chain amino acid transport system permease protein n=1 Tax=Azospirillum rugosum TaxID=416170 RepID=A0ABS4SMC4_9PROT|nr:branched-chain amino acid ABC transporter permease [Azospirillum rugosum]MBP2293717.1 branched-chain amino acid transport system permease protein [Azospirillum rugosum]MDQ0527262.1 branched-chain amino acid transport system permease protein [Azospirillum rugosum]
MSERTIPTPVKAFGALALLALAALLPLVVTEPSQQNFLILILMGAQLGVAWNIVGGYAGQVSLGHAVFYGIGAYTSTMLLLTLGLSPWVGALAGGGVSVLFALAMGWPCFRLKGHYFAMATIAVAEIVQILVTNSEFLEGAVGLSLPMDQSGWGVLIFLSKLPYYYVILGLLVLTVLTAWAIERSHIGYYFRAIKDEPEAARALGVSLTRYKLIALSVSAFLTALGGSFYAQKEMFIDPGSVLAGAISIKIALIAILGGVGTLLGPVLGAAVLITIEEYSRTLFGSTGSGTDMIIYAAMIILVAVFSPSGVLGLLGDLRRFLPGARSKGPDMADKMEIRP